MRNSGIQSIDHGIVFLMAEWSGGAKWAYRQLIAFLEQRSFPLERLHVLDVDHHPKGPRGHGRVDERFEETRLVEVREDVRAVPFQWLFHLHLEFDPA